MAIDKSKIDLNRPAFGENAQKVEELTTEETPVESQPKEEVVEEPVASEEETETKVPYQRMKRYRDEAVQLREEAEQARRDAEQWRLKAESRETVREPESGEVPSWWEKLYGDSDASKEAWKINQRANLELREQIAKEARQEALEAVRSERREEEQRVEQNVGLIDDSLDQLAENLGRGLTEKEQSAVLDIVDDYTPKDEDGNYLGATLPFDKAWEIYEMKNQTQNFSKTKSRDAVAAINGSQSQGEPSAIEKNKNFNPLSWGSIGRNVE